MEKLVRLTAVCLQSRTKGMGRGAMGPIQTTAGSTAAPKARTLTAGPIRWISRLGFFVGVMAAVAAVLAGCGGGTTAPVPVPVSGEFGVFVATAVYSSATPGQGSIATGTKLSALRAGKGTPVWSKALNQVYAGPVVADGMLFGTFGALQSNSGPPHKAPITALRSVDGKQVWQVTPPEVAIPATADNEAVYAVSASLDTLLALRASDGRQLWRTDLGGVLQGNQPITEANGTIYCVVAPEVGQFAVVALGASDGKQQWSTALTPSFRGAVSPPVVSGNAVVVGGVAHMASLAGAPEVPTVIALRASDGSILWTTLLSTISGVADDSMSLVAGDSGIYTTVPLGPQGASFFPGGMLVGLNPQSGAQVWSTMLAGPTGGEQAFQLGQANSLLAGSGTLYVTTLSPGSGSGPPNAISAYNQADGKQLWSQSVQSDFPDLVGSASGSIFASVKSSSSQTPASPPGAYIEALDANDGSLQWKVEAAGLLMAQVAPF